MTTLQEAFNVIDLLPKEEQEQLFEVLAQRRKNERQAEILANANEVKQAFKEGKAWIGSVDDLIIDLLEDDNASCLE